jgi:imidazoleglycerol-phosphate dehydratase
MNDEGKARLAHRKRTTKETDIEARLIIDGEGSASLDTGIGFLDHMLELFAHHAELDLELNAKGDLHVDYHHTVEDLGLVLGECVEEALGDKRGVNRFGTAHVPLDEALTRVVIDLSGRPYLSWNVAFTSERVGNFPTELFEDFFRAFADRARVTLHVETLYGRNNHHIIETVFKAFARSFRQAVTRGPKPGIPSTKGTLQD